MRLDLIANLILPLGSRKTSRERARVGYEYDVKIKGKHAVLFFAHLEERGANLTAPSGMSRSVSYLQTLILGHPKYGQVKQFGTS